MRNFVVLSLLIFPKVLFGQFLVADLRTENLVDPIAIDIESPRFSWLIESSDRNVYQVAFQVRVFQGKEIVWDSEKVGSDKSVFVEYGGPALSSNNCYEWQVQLWDNRNRETGWSSRAKFCMGLLQQVDWQAKWIEISEREPTDRPVQLFRKEFLIKKGIKSARLYTSAHGMYVARINGQRIGQDHFTPGWTSYKHRLQYQVYDVLSVLEMGANGIGIEVGNGWYRSNLGWESKSNLYGEHLGVLAQLVVEYQNGTKETICSDESWKWNFGEITYSEIYHGETVDARLTIDGWAQSGLDDSSWKEVRIGAYPMDNLLATYNEPVRGQEELDVVNVLITPDGDTVLDFGQNLVGYVEVVASGSAGDEIQFSHAETLDRDGNFYTKNLRTAKQQNKYILSGNGSERFGPRFSWQGFRYVRIDKYPGHILKENFKAIVLHSDMRSTGKFECSDVLVNKLQENIVWSQKGNFVDVPTDCPQRDERLGWTGDAQVFGRTAMFNFDVHNFFVKWMKDLAIDQKTIGKVPFVVPDILGGTSAGSAGWGDAATIVPWELYQVYGDLRILEEQYESMRSWVGYMKRNSNNDLWNKGFHFGDWMFYRPFDDKDGMSAVTDKGLIAQCFYAYSTSLLIKAASALGREQDVHLYSELLERIKAAFLREFVTRGGRLVSGTQTAYLLTLQFDLLPEELRDQAARRLVDNIHSYGDHLTTGFLGTPYICDVLTRFGYLDLAYTLLLQRDYPSWLYPITKGATTIWERWDGIMPSGELQTPNMNSFNHYAYGAIGDWLYRYVAGLNTSPENPGFKISVIKPHMGGGLKHAKMEFKSMYGTIKSGWEIKNNEFFLNVELPPNTSGKVYVPIQAGAGVFEGGNSVDVLENVKVIGEEDGYMILEVSSGVYKFKTGWGEEH